MDNIKLNNKIKYLINNNYSKELIDFICSDFINYNNNFKPLTWVARECKRLQTNKKSKTFIKNINLILNWYNNVKNINLDKLDFKKALFYAKKWDKKYFEKLVYSKDIYINNLNEENIIYSTDNFNIVKIDCPLKTLTENRLMNHCLSPDYFHFFGSSAYVYSLRDKKNKPHITFTLTVSNNEIVLFEIAGKNNTTPLETYLETVIKYFDFIINIQFVLNVMNIKNCDFETKLNIINNYAMYLPDYKYELINSGFFAVKNIVIYNLELIKNEYFLEFEKPFLGETLIDIEKLEQISKWHQRRDKSCFKDEKKCRDFIFLLDNLIYQRNLKNHPMLPFKEII